MLLELIFSFLSVKTNTKDPERPVIDFYQRLENKFVDHCQRVIVAYAADSDARRGYPMQKYHGSSITFVNQYIVECED